jgi:hypothetical protein
MMFVHLRYNFGITGKCIRNLQGNKDYFSGEKGMLMKREKPFAAGLLP